MANSHYGTRLQGIMGVVFNKTYRRLGNTEYNYHDSLRARLIGGIGHWNSQYLPSQANKNKSANDHNKDYSLESVSQNPYLGVELSSKLDWAIILTIRLPKQTKHLAFCEEILATALNQLKN